MSKKWRPHKHMAAPKTQIGTRVIEKLPTVITTRASFQRRSPVRYVMLPMCAEHLSPWDEKDPWPIERGIECSVTGCENDAVHKVRKTKVLD